MGIIDLILDLSEDRRLWESSQPIGSESFRIIELVRQLSATIYDYQLLNLIVLRDEPNDNETITRIQSTLAYFKTVDPSFDFKFTDKNVTSQNILPFLMIDIKFAHIAFRQQLLFHDLQMPLKFKFPERKVKSASTVSTESMSKLNQKQSIKNKEKTKKQKYSRKSTHSVRSTTTRMISDDYHVESFTTSLPDKYTLLNRFQNSPLTLSSSSVSLSGSTSWSATSMPAAINSSPSIYFGKIVFNENNLFIPLASKNKSIGKFWEYF